MIYISKGLVCSGSTEERLTISHCGKEFLLTGRLAVLWQNGRYGFETTKTPQEDSTLWQLTRMGLAEQEQENSPVSRYRILSRCILCPVKTNGMSGPVFKKEDQTMLLWIRKAGLRLTTAELVYLTEKRIQPQEHLLYGENRQALVETIYTVDNIADNILETQMEHAAARDAAVDTIVRLLRKKKIALL